MLEDHSSRWSAAASPGGMIAAVLLILSLLVATGSVLAILDIVQIEISQTVLAVLLGVSAFFSLIFLYLLVSYSLFSYTLDSQGLTMAWGFWREKIPYNEIEAVESAADVLGEQDMGWQLFWPGYYVGTRKTDVGDIQVAATLPPRRQLLVVRSDGEIFAISPERPLLFTEELIRWHRMFHEAAPDAEPPPQPERPPQRSRDQEQPRQQPPPPQPSQEQHVPVELPPSPPVAPAPAPAAPPVERIVSPQEAREQRRPPEPESPPAPAPSGPSFGYQHSAGEPPVAPAAPPAERRDSSSETREQRRPPEPESPSAPAPSGPSFGHQQPTGPPSPMPPQPVRSEAPPVDSQPSSDQPIAPPERPAPASAEQPLADEPMQQPAAPAPPPEDQPNAPPERPAPAPAEQPPSDEPIQQPTAPAPPPPPPGPVFGTSFPADQDPATGQRFGASAPDVAPAFGIPVHVELEPLPEPEIDPASEAPTAPYEVWFPDPPSESEEEIPYVQEQEPVRSGLRSPIPFTAPEPVLAPSGRPRREVLQPLTRVYRQEPDPTSPALRPMLHRDRFSLAVAGIGVLTTVAMVGYIMIQYDDIPPSLTLHWNVDGLPGRVGEPREIWILPVIAGLVLIANVGLAWSIAQFDRFAARLLVSSTLLVHLVTWLALIMLLN